MRLQGIGPKTVALLYHTLNVRSLDDLEAAAKAGAIRGLKGMGAKKEALILTAIAERRRHAGRHLIGHACETAETLVAWLREAAPDATYDIVGSLRRGAETSGDIDILATNAPAEVLGHFTRFRQVERVLGLGDTKASILLTSQMQADLRLVPAESRGAALQYFTGSKAHNIALRQRALSRGYTLNEYALADAATGARIAGETEDGIYAALGLPCIDPTLREARGEIDAAEAGTLPRLVTLEDLQGDVHMHTTASDGRHDIETMAIAARDAGRSYICITDHSQSLAMANGLDDARALAHAARIREANARVDGITILAGIEVDILADGRLDLEESTLAALDFVVASVHSAFDQTAEAMTVRVLTAMACPFVDAIGHPTGRKILRREPHRIDIEALIEAAGLYGIALEINSNYHRLDLSDVHARRAKAQGVGLLINSDAHSTTELGLLRWGVLTARRAWLEPADVWNTRDVDAFRNGLRRHRRPAAARRDGHGDRRRDAGPPEGPLLRDDAGDDRGRLRRGHRPAQDAAERRRARARRRLHGGPGRDAPGMAERAKTPKRPAEAARRPSSRRSDVRDEARHEGGLFLTLLLPLDHLLRVEAERLGHVAVDGELLDVALGDARQQVERDRRRRLRVLHQGRRDRQFAHPRPVHRDRAQHLLGDVGHARERLDLGLGQLRAAQHRGGDHPVGIADQHRALLARALHRQLEALRHGHRLQHRNHLLRLGLDRNLVARVDERRVGVLGRDLRPARCRARRRTPAPSRWCPGARAGRRRPRPAGTRWSGWRRWRRGSRRG